MRDTIVLEIRRAGRCLHGCMVAAMLACGTSPAFAETPGRYAISQPAQPLADALRAIARQTGASLVFDPKAVQGVTAAPLAGEFSAAEAIGRLVQGTGLALTVQPEGVLVVRPAAGRSGAPVPAASTPTSGRATEPVQLALAPGEAGAPGGVLPEQGAVLRTTQKIEITGSRLRRIDGEMALPVNVYTREEIERSGQASLGSFLAGLNEVSMGQGEGSFAAATQGQGTVQLRGLPLGSTLVLINGRRVQAVGSSSANFFNLNLIPLAAVERVEVVPVGSSAVYGGDALAGVVNVILRKSIDGQALSLRATSGKGFGDGGFSFGFGDRGDDADWMVLASYNRVTPLTTGERDFFRDADYRRFGGPDARVRGCTPGTVSSVDGGNLPGLAASEAGIPTLAPGQVLTVGSFAATAGQPNLCSADSNSGATALIHGGETLSLHATGERRWGGGFAVFGELTHVKDQVRTEGLGLNLYSVEVPAGNPANPFGAPVLVTARLGLQNGKEGYDRRTDFSRVLGGVRGPIAGGWEYEASASVSRDTGERLLVNNHVDYGALAEALASSDPATSLNPFTAGRAASDAVLGRIWSDSVRTSFGRKAIVSGFVRGPAYELPAGPVDAIVGVEVARDRYETVLPDTAFLAGRRTTAAYGELRVPLWKTSAPGEGDWSLAALTVATRRDRYQEFGSADTYQGGLELRPAKSLLLRASAATSFKPPTLVQTNVEEMTFPLAWTGLTDPARGNAVVTSGDWVRTTNQALQPEKGKALALGALWEPAGLAGSRFGLTAWRVRIDGLIGLLSPQVMVNNEALFPGWVTRGPSQGGVPGPITRLLWMESNVGFVETRGIDLEAGRSWRTPAGRWSLSATATRATAYDVAITPSAPVEDRLGTRFDEYWAPKWKARLAAGFDEGAWSVGITSRYLGRYRDLPPEGRPLGNTWMHDLSGRLDLVRLGLGLGTVKAAALSLVLSNLTDRQPSYASGWPYFDPSQGDWRGRFASVRLSVDW